MMIRQIGQIMLYVHNQDEAVKFWTEKIGFRVISEENEEMRWIEMAPVKGTETSIILHDKQMVAKMEPEMNLGTPSLMFFTDDIDEWRRDLLSKGVRVGEIVQMPSGRVCNFADNEDNYFAVMEKQ
ncbi:glyoxalase/bleomycin resistance/extradiol dioxygenase family protein [Fischerella thermalis CCMEE 5273]|nr:glyoxalase/bleomycin resistance/extradiol dioxygenase family protein [Fischerella thermalis CCMEE 5273]